MTDLSPEAQSILEAGRDLDGAGDLEKARVRRALFAKIAAGGAVLAATSTAAAESGAVAGGTTAGTAAATTAATGAGTFSAIATPLAKILIPLAIVTGGAAGGFVAWRAQRAMGPAPVAAPAAPTVTAPVAPVVVPAAPVLAPAVEAQPAPASRPVHRARVAPAARTEAEVAPVNHLAEETALLASANAELRRGDARRALALLDGYDRRYPAGVLREEVLATRVIAGCQQSQPGTASAARRAAQTFLARHPASPLASRVRTSCE